MAPAAFAAPPANDDFANAQAIGPSLPVELSESNEGATKEEGEPIHASLGSKGHSVWFKWQATSTGFVTVGTCGSDFRAVTSVYTGTKVSELTKVAGDYASEGPGCPAFDGREVTFKGTSGATYEIAVDGDAYYVPPAEAPLGEGNIELRVEATPPPPNDDFHNAMPILSKAFEEPGGDRFYYAAAPGYNWGATKEVGEPDHAGNPGGASVWYSWTAPESAVAQIIVCCGSANLLGVYVGGSVDSLTPLAPVAEPPLGSRFAVTADTTYGIAVDGESAGAEAAQGSLILSISMPLPRMPFSQQSSTAPSVITPPTLDVTAPDTTLNKVVLTRLRPLVVFRFDSTEAGSTFRCKRDRHPWTDCAAPVRFARPGHHVLRVAAVDAAGNVDPSPAVARFKILGHR